MPTTYKTLGQTTATAASSTMTVNLITDPVIEGIQNSAQTNISNGTITATSLTGTLWRIQAETSTNRFTSGVNQFNAGNAKAAYAGTNSFWCGQTAVGTNQIGFVFGATSTQGSMTFTGTGNYQSGEVVNSIAVSPSTTYYYGGYINSDGANITVSFRIKWYTSTGTYISASSFDTAVNQAWTKVNSSSTSPSNAAYAAVHIYTNVNQNIFMGIDNVWFSTDSGSSTTFPTPSTNTANAVLTAPFNKRGENVWSGTANSSTTVTTFAGALTDLYTVPASTQTVVSTITATNLTTSATSCRVLVLPSGQTAAKKNFIVFDGSITANTTQAYTLGITLNAGDKLQVASDVADVSFSAFGSEIA